jgi:hypothetical protein
MIRSRSIDLGRHINIDANHLALLTMIKYDNLGFTTATTRPACLSLYSFHRR